MTLKKEQVEWTQKASPPAKGGGTALRSSCTSQSGSPKPVQVRDFLQASIEEQREARSNVVGQQNILR
jgi:hypothetical protein